MLVTAILALLGISFLLLAETERRIAENEKRAAQALYAAEAGLRTVKRWFDEPDGALLFPEPSDVDRTLRRIVDESDPDPADAVPADGVLGSYPYYKQGWDADADGRDDLFGRPYSGSLEHTLQGTRDGPDLRIDDAAGAAAFLANLSTTLFGDLPGEPGGVRARISRIDVYAPPYERFGATWQRSGIATVAITARIYQDHGGSSEVLAERRLEAVLGEAPYRKQGPHGPLHSCGDISFVPRAGGDMTVRWGAMTARGDINVGSDPDAPPIPQSLPRYPPSRPGEDRLYPTNPTDFDTLLGAVADTNIADPWFRILAGGRIIGGGSQPQVVPPSITPQDYSNLIQNLGVAICPHYEYRVWKSIAQSGGPDVRYFAWIDGAFKENGWGEGRTFQEITDGQAGVFFFDTENGAEPEDTDSDGTFDNLTPPIRVSGAWRFTGFVFLNADSIQVDGVTGGALNFRPPGEPFLDQDDDGAYDTGERFVNLNYGTASPSDGAVDAFESESGLVRDPRGPDVTGGTVSFRGILYNNGSFEATGSGTFYGSVIATEGVTQETEDGSVDTPTLVWDDSLARDWPPGDLQGVPRVVITDWDAGH